MPKSDMHGGEDAPVKGKLKVVENGDGVNQSLEFMFNPAKLSISAKSKFEQPPQSGSSGGGASRPQFNGNDPRTMSLELWFDDWMSTSSTNVENAVKTLLSWTRPTAKSQTAKKPNPPLVVLNWGGGEGRKITREQMEFFPMFLNSVSYEYSLFDTAGKPMRARVTLSGQEVPTEGRPQNPTSGSRESRHAHMTVEGDTLASIAQGYYGKPTLWRGLAKANNIDDPLRLPAGRPLFIPDIEEVAKQS